MIGAYSTPAEGYLTLFPKTDLGSDLPVAMYRTGERSGTPSVTASGYALVVNGVPVRIKATDLHAARRQAVASCHSGPVVVCEAVSRARDTLYRKVEVVNVSTPAHSDLRDDSKLVSFSGLLIEKSLNPYEPTDAATLARRIASQLRFEEKKILAPQIKAWLDELDYDWAKLTPSQFNRAFSGARTRLRAAIGPASKDLLPVMQEQVKVSVEGVIAGTKKVLRSNFIPTMGLSLSQPELDAANKIATMNGWFVRDSFGVRSDQLTVQGRTIVEDGLKQGLGREQIARNLRDGLPAAWGKYGLNYYKVLAANSVSRARSFSEVTSYAEAGIEALEIQAILDERTTEICRCLDGQIIDVNLVSEQMNRAMDVARPEDIYNASPFLQVVTSQNSGMQTIVTTNNATPIAAIIRSGMGVVNDRGQFANFRVGNQLTEVNLGPPPYHHLCRSWTIPVSSTIQVPANYTPVAVQSPPVVPSVKPLRPSLLSLPQTPLKTPPRLAEPHTGRPQTSVLFPTAAKPTITGNPAVIDRLAFPDDFINSQTLSEYVGGATRQGVTLRPNIAAAYKPYQLDAATGKIRSSAKWAKVPPGSENQYGLLKQEMAVAVKDVGIAVDVNVIDSAFIKELTLAESSVSGGVRGYSVHGVRANERLYLRFDHNSKRAAKSALSDLKKAKSAVEVEKALLEIEKKGFLKTSKKPDLFFGGMTPTPVAEPKLTPRPGVKPKPIPKPKPLVSPRATRKPPPVITEPSIPGQPKTPAPRVKPKPKPTEVREGPARDYSEYGLVQGESLETQVKMRIEIETAKLQDYMAAEEAKVGKALNRKQKGKAIKKFFKEQVNPSTSHITNQDVFHRTSTDSRIRAEYRAYETYREEAGAKMGSFERKDFKLLKLDELGKAWQSALEYTGPRLQQLTFDDLPPIVRLNAKSSGARSRAWYVEFENKQKLIQVTGKNIKGIEDQLKHEVSHFLDTKGQNGRAAKIAQKLWRKGSYTENLAGSEYYEGRWGDQYCGRVYADEKTSEITSMMAEAFSTGREATLGNLYEANPEHIGFYLSYVQGAFL